MPNAITYNSKGMITKNIVAPPDMLEMQVDEGDFLLIGNHGDYHTEFVLDGVIINRTIQATTLNKLTLNADGMDVINISDSPLGTFTVRDITNKQILEGIIEGSDSFSTTIPGTYKIKIESFPYLDFEATIEAI